MPITKITFAAEVCHVVGIFLVLFVRAPPGIACLGNGVYARKDFFLPLDITFHENMFMSIIFFLS